MRFNVPAASASASSTRFAKYRQRVCWIDGEIRRLWNAVAADQRLHEPMRMSDVVETEAPLDAQSFVIGRTVASFDADDRIVRHVISELAAHAAIGAHRRHFAIDRRQVRIIGGRERAGRARLHAFAARDAR
jgi:hypothetical protein